MVPSNSVGTVVTTWLGDVLRGIKQVVLKTVPPGIRGQANRRATPGRRQSMREPKLEHRPPPSGRYL
jgi:hypothetical protein